MVSPDEPVSAVLPDNPVETATGPADMFRAAEGPMGIARSRDHRRTRWRAPTAHRPVFPSGDALDVRIGLRAPLPIDDFVFGIGIFNAEGVCCYGTNTTIEELDAAAPGRRRRGDLLDRVARSRRRHLQARRRGPQDRRLSVRLPPPALHLPREVAREGRRDLPAAARAGVSPATSRSRRPTATSREPARRSRRSRASSTTRAPPAGGSSSPTASSTCCTRATCAISRRPARTAMC